MGNNKGDRMRSLIRESRIVLDHCPIWRKPTPLAWTLVVIAAVVIAGIIAAFSLRGDL